MAVVSSSLFKRLAHRTHRGPCLAYVSSVVSSVGNSATQLDRWQSLVVVFLSGWPIGPIGDLALRVYHLLYHLLAIPQRNSIDGSRCYKVTLRNICSNNTES